MGNKIKLWILEYVPAWLLPNSVITYCFTSLLKQGKEEELDDIFL